MDKRMHERMCGVERVLSNVEACSKRTEKESWLLSCADRELLIDTLHWTYNPNIIFGINSATFSGDENRFGFATQQFDSIFDLLEYLSKSNSSNETKANTLGFLNKFSDEPRMYELYKKIILKDLKIGVNTETINKVFPKTIPVFKVALCEPYEGVASLRGARYIVQPKLDGVRCIAVITLAGHVELFTRNGSKISGYTEIENALSDAAFRGYVLDGEIMGEDFDNTMEGLFALGKRKKAVYTIFDCMSIEQFKSRNCNKTYLSRWQDYQDIYATYKCSLNEEDLNPLAILTGDLVPRFDFIRNSFEINKKYTDEGYEGTVLKDADSPYLFKRSFHWIKYKEMITDEFMIVDFESGTGKYSNSLGAIVVSTKTGKFVGVGSGFSDEQRDFIWKNQDSLIFKWCEVKYQEMTKDGSLRFPTFVKFRDDK